MHPPPAWQVAYAYELLGVDVGGGPTAGGTLVTLSGRGFTRAAARAATARQRFGNLWWGRAAALSPRCSFGPGGFSTPLLMRDTLAVCAAPPLPGPGGGAGAAVPLLLALNAFRFDKHAGADSPGWLTSATKMGAPRTAQDGTPFDAAHFVREQGTSPRNFSYYAQHAAHAAPAGGPTAGGTIVVLTGSGFESRGRGTAACRFGPQLATPLRWESDAAANCTAPAWPADSGPPPIPRSPGGEPLSAPTLHAPLRLALNLRNDSGCVLCVSGQMEPHRSCPPLPRPRPQPRRSRPPRSVAFPPPSALRLLAGRLVRRTWRGQTSRGGTPGPSVAKRLVANTVPAFSPGRARGPLWPRSRRGPPLAMPEGRRGRRPWPRGPASACAQDIEAVHSTSR